MQLIKQTLTQVKKSLYTSRIVKSTEYINNIHVVHYEYKPLQGLHLM